MIQNRPVSINLQEKGQAYIAGRDWQIHLFLQCLCFKCHPPMNLVPKHTLEFDEMSVLLSPDQIRWMKVKQEQKYYFCHFFLCITGIGSVGEISLKQIPIPAQCHPLIWQAADDDRFRVGKGTRLEEQRPGQHPYNTSSHFTSSKFTHLPSIPASNNALWKYGFFPALSKHG